MWCRFLYWTDLHIRGPVVERALLNGQERMQISAETTRSPTNVAVDSETGDVYWIKYNKHSSSSKIVRYSQQMEVPVNLGDHSEFMVFYVVCWVSVKRDNILGAILESSFLYT